MRSRIVGLAFFFLAVVTLAGCGDGSGPNFSGGAHPPTAAPTTSPAASLDLFVGSPTKAGVAEYDALTGSLKQTFAKSVPYVGYLGADDAGNIYVNGIGSGTFSGFGKFAIGGSTPLTQYYQSNVDDVVADSIEVSPGGEVVFGDLDANEPFSGYTYNLYIWDAGASGSPSRTLTYPGDTIGAFALDPRGTLYVAYVSSTGVRSYDVIPAGQSSPVRTIRETIAPASPTFKASWLGATADGTLYVAEWTYSTPDPEAGLYVYPPGGAETKITSMKPGITGLDFDAAGNVYVASSNSSFTNDNPSGYQADTAHQLSIYSPRGASLLKQFDDKVPGVSWLTVAGDGSLYLVQSAPASPNVPESGSIYRVAPRASSAQLLVPKLATFSNVVVFDGTRGTQIRASHAFRAGDVGHAISAAIRCKCRAPRVP